MDPKKQDERFQQPQPKAYGEKTIEELYKDLERRVRRLESQAGTA
jgi:hypothetical protein